MGKKEICKHFYIPQCKWMNMAITSWYLLTHNSSQDLMPFFTHSTERKEEIENMNERK
jgi:hypothetical protein